MLELKSWHYDLPKELGLECAGVPQNEPAVYLLHMVHHTAFILLMKQSVQKLQDEGKVHLNCDPARRFFYSQFSEATVLMKRTTRRPPKKLPIRQRDLQHRSEIPEGVRQLPTQSHHRYVLHPLGRPDAVERQEQQMGRRGRREQQQKYRGRVESPGGVVRILEPSAKVSAELAEAVSTVPQRLGCCVGFNDGCSIRCTR